MYEIGHGAYGTVYLAERRDGERVAVKLCRRDAVGDERYARELRGAKLYKAIPHHDGLVQMRELVETEWGDVPVDSRVLARQRGRQALWLRLSLFAHGAAYYIDR